MCDFFISSPCPFALWDSPARHSAVVKPPSGACLLAVLTPIKQAQTSSGIALCPGAAFTDVKLLPKETGAMANEGYGRPEGTHNNACEALLEALFAWATIAIVRK